MTRLDEQKFEIDLDADEGLNSVVRVAYIVFHKHTSHS